MRFTDGYLDSTYKSGNNKNAIYVSSTDIISAVNSFEWARPSSESKSPCLSWWRHNNDKSNSDTHVNDTHEQVLLNAHIAQDERVNSIIPSLCVSRKLSELCIVNL